MTAIKMPGIKVKLSILFLAISIQLSAFSYKDTIESHNKSNFIIEPRLHYGFIINHHKKMAHLTNSHFPSFEINIAKQTNGQKEWQRKYGYPQTGISFWYSDLGNSQYLGNSFAIIPYINFPIFESGRFRFCYRFGLGLSWLTKTFEQYDDYKNIAISSNLNAAIKSNFEVDWYYKKLMFSGGIGLTHFSDAGFKKPNLGLNIATLNIGGAYFFRESKRESKKVNQQDLPISKLTKTNNFSILCRIGTKGILPPKSKNYIVYNLGTEYLRKLSYKSEIGGGLEASYDLSDQVLARRFGDTTNQGSKFIKPGIFIAYQLDISKLKLQFNIGRYLYTRYIEDGYVYNRLVLQYPINDKFYFNLSLKSYNFTADVTEFGIGWKIN